MVAPLHAQRIAVPAALHWRTAQPGMVWTDFEVHAGALRIPLRIVVVRLQPRAFDLSLVLRTRANHMTGAWTVDSADADVALAVNAGQFKETGPWGWLVLHSYEQRPPGFGPLSVGIAFDTSGAMHWLLPAAMARARNDRTIRFAFQSYPLLIHDKMVPALLRTSPAVDRTHRDARLMLGALPDGQLLLVLTRYDALRGIAQRVPIGLTVPESVSLMQALGARHAVMLDGGISAQLLLRDSVGSVHQWNGLREVPLALIARPKRR